MKPILYTADETAFASNGLGILSDAISCTVTQERNGSYELEMEYPLEGIHYEELALRRIILALPDSLSQTQPFRIYEISRPIGGTVTVYAQHVAYDLMGIPVTPFTSTSAAEAMVKLKSNAVTACPFDFWTDKSTVATMTVTVPSSIWSLLGGTDGGILDTYAGEYEFDRWSVKLHGSRGSNRGVSIRYGKNLTDLKQEENCANVYTGLYPYWTDSQGNLMELPERIVSAEGTFGYTRILPYDFSQEWQEQPTEEQLRAKAETYIKANKIGVPKVSLDVSFIQLAETEEYKDLKLLEQVSLCDTVNVEFPSLGVSATAACIKVKFDCLTERIDSMEIGDAKSSFVDTILDTSAAAAELPDKTDLQKAIEHATSLIAGSTGGHVVIVRDDAGQPIEICVLSDTDDLNTATSLWRWNEAGLGHSSNGYNGSYSLALTKDGAIVADRITTGTLSAARIKAGILADKKGKNYWNMETGAFSLSAATTVGGSTVSDIASSAADTAASSAASAAVSDYDSSLTQQKIFNKLTGGGGAQGIYLSEGKVYINATYIQAGTLSADYVNLKGGLKTYKSNGKLSGTLGYLAGGSDAGQTDGIGFTDATGASEVKATDAGVIMSHGDYYVNAFSRASNNTGAVVLKAGSYYVTLDDNSASFSPTGEISLGTAGSPWGDLYASSGNSTTSDRNRKHSIEYEDLEKYRALFHLLKPCRFKYNDGTSDRYHMGFIAQDVEEAMEAVGLTSQDFGGYVKGQDAETGEDCYFLRYDEFIPINTMVLQSLVKRVDALETMVKELKEGEGT